MPYVSDEKVDLPYSFVEIGTGEQIEEANFMEFRLLYEGEIASTGNKGDPVAVHAIRRNFHPQLRRLWAAEENLRQFCYRHIKALPAVPNDYQFTLQERFDYGIKDIGQRWSRAGYEFVPLATDKIDAKCSLNILLLRPELEKKLVLRRGDIDGQVKTLFDALRLPENLDETGGMKPQEDETPFYCLLEDDRLVSEIQVLADRLLLLPHQKQAKPNDCFAVIHVKLAHRTPRTFDNWLA